MSNPTIVKISMFGDLEIINQDKILKETSNRSKKIWNLLGFIISNRHNQLTQNDYIDMLWPDGISSNPVNALKTLLYRSRSLLEPILINNEQFILSGNGSYYWNNEINCTVDIEEFEQFYNIARNPATPMEERLFSYNKAIHLYKGDFLTKHSTELWVIPIATHYHNLYLECVKTYLSILEENKEYKSIIACCKQTLQIDSFDEKIHAFLIRAYLKEGNTVAALNHYDTATDILYQNLGVKPSKELRSLYVDMMKTQQTLEMDLTVIQNDLKEAEYKTGAFVCEYGIFQETYRLISRQSARDGRSVYIALITACEANGDIPPLKILNDIMENLLVAIVNSLRRGDVVSRYSGAQYVLLLPSVTQEDGTLILERIAKKYYHTNKRTKIQLKYKLRQIEISPEEY